MDTMVLRREETGEFPCLCQIHFTHFILLLPDSCTFPTSCSALFLFVYVVAMQDHTQQEAFDTIFLCCEGP